MTYTDITILIPSHSLEDFPTELEEPQAASLLNAFAVAWHPLLLATARVIPGWHRSDSPPEPPGGRLIIVPMASETWLQGGWIERARLDGACVVHGISEREPMIAAALEPLGVEAQVDSELVADFFALGSCYLQVELLTRRMHYFSNLDEVQLQREVLAAADAAVADDAIAARAHLRNCFEALTGARERFYPVECYLIDLCLLIPRLADEQLKKTVAAGVPFNLLILAADVDTIAQENAEIIATLKDAWHQGRLDILGGELREVASPLVPLESWLFDVKQGQEVFARHFGRTPTTWGRRRFGLSPLVPQVLHKFGYRSALHFLLDDGIYPDAEQSKIRWEGCDGSIVDAITRIPLAADSAVSFLRFPLRMAEAMQEDQVAAIVFARWPEVRGPWFEDFRRTHAYSPVLGRFVTFHDYFEQTEDPGRLSNFSAGEYLSPFLAQAVAREEPNAISRFTNHTARRRDYEAADWFRGVAKVLVGQPIATADAEKDENLLEASSADGSAEAVHAAESMLDHLVPESATELANVLTRGGASQPGVILLNSLSFARTASVELPDFEGPPPIGGPVKAVQFDETRRTAVITVPPCGFVWLPTVSAAGARPSATAAVTATSDVLRNEFLEIYMNEATGGIAQIKGHGRSPNRISQQLAYRFRHKRTVPTSESSVLGDDKSYYSEMRRLSSEVTCNGPTLGEVVTRGDIVDQVEGRRLAGFQQTTRLWAGRRIVEIDIILEVEQMPERDPWTNYYASRFAWNDESASLTRGMQGTAQPFKGERFESSEFLEIATEEQRTTILHLGLPYHRTTGPRMVDSILLVAGETERRFRFAIAIDAEYPTRAALDAMTPVAVVSTERRPPAGDSGWFFSVDAKNVQITRIMAAPDVPHRDAAQPKQPDSDKLSPARGFALRLMETEGRFRQVRLKCFSTPSRARHLDLRGRTLADLSIENDCVVIDMTAYEIADVELRFED
ncbi:MAG: hypothetical protein WD648_03590 [Planctomycetaceae bacterium]